MSKDAFELRRRALEEAFFHQKEHSLVEKLREVFHLEHDRQSLREFTGIDDEVVLDRLVSLEVSGESLAAFNLFPLCEVAWADGKVDERERVAVLKAAAEVGIKEGSTAYKLLANALAHRPTIAGRKAWYAYAAALNRKLSAREREVFKEQLLRRAQAVAGASGGILDTAFTISAAEKRVLKAIEEAFEV